MPCGICIIHSLTVYFCWGQPTTEQLGFEARLNHLKYLLRSRRSPTDVGELCGRTATQGRTYGMETLVGLGSSSSQLSYTGCSLFYCQEKTSHDFLVWVQDRCCTEHLFCPWHVRRRAMGKREPALINNSSGRTVSDCFKSCAPLVFPSAVIPVRLIGAVFFVNLVSGRKFGRNSG